MSEVSYESNVEFCPHCEEVREGKDIEFLGLVEELGNIPRFRCNICKKTFDTLPPTVTPEKPKCTPPQ